MEHVLTPEQQQALEDIRVKLQKRRGFGSRIAKLLNVREFKVYRVAKGQIRDPKILKALIEEAKMVDNPQDPYAEILTQYINNAA